MNEQYLQGYKYHKCGTVRDCTEPLKIIHQYTFLTEKKHQYIVNVEQYVYDMFVVKFYLKSHSDSKKKYNHLTGYGNARKIIYTCIQIGFEIFNRNPKASFGFLGSPTEEEMQTTKLCKTKRFQTYNYYAKFFFSPDNFEHSNDESKSSYIMLNKARKKEDPKLLVKIIKMFEDHYIVNDVYFQRI